jgi:hypothetical protein
VRSRFAGIIAAVVELGAGEESWERGVGSRIESSAEEARDNEVWEDIIRRCRCSFG